MSVQSDWNGVVSDREIFLWSFIANKSYENSSLPYQGIFIKLLMNICENHNRRQLFIVLIQKFMFLSMLVKGKSSEMCIGLLFLKEEEERKKERKKEKETKKENQLSVYLRSNLPQEKSLWMAFF